MSPIDSIPGIEGLVIQRVERAKNIHVWAHTQRLGSTPQSRDTAFIKPYAHALDGHVQPAALP